MTRYWICLACGAVNKETEETMKECIACHNERTEQSPVIADARKPHCGLCVYKSICKTYTAMHEVLFSLQWKRDVPENLSPKYVYVSRTNRKYTEVFDALVYHPFYWALAAECRLYQDDRETRDPMEDMLLEKEIHEMLEKWEREQKKQAKRRKVKDDVR